MLVVEYFGRLLPSATLAPIDAAEEDLHSVFRNRAGLMGWLSDSDDQPSRLWAMEEAELTPGDPQGRIGFVQVGVDPGQAGGAAPPPILTEAAAVDLGIAAQGSPAVYLGYLPPASIDPIGAIPPLIQCVDDALHRFGDVDADAVQLTGRFLPPRAESAELQRHAYTGWFTVAPGTPSVPAVLSVECALAAAPHAGLLRPRLTWAWDGPFRCLPLPQPPPDCRVQLLNDWQLGVRFGEPARPDQLRLAFRVDLPEWTPAAVGWVLMGAADAVLSYAGGGRALQGLPACDFSARVTRLAATGAGGAG